ncbi:hypothetical protein HDV04_000035 [Boothiomyces sp. JEL0838]|nr:hypothetical protein HDV04_000035 [Boothiomyces sp. JEL0838]
MHLVLTTIALLGTVEFAHGTNYLLSLGLSKPLSALVWLAGPLSGLVVQPLIGTLSDQCTSKYGKRRYILLRRPFVILGSIALNISIILIAYSELFAYYTSWFGISTANMIIFYAVVGFYLLDFSINVVQASCRNLIVDVVESSQQKNGNAMAGIMLGIGNCVGYFVGYLDLTAFGGTQLQNLCWIAIFMFNVTVGLTCYFTNEQQQEVVVKSENPFVSIYENIENLPKNIAQVCNIQFFSWMGWFPFLFYSATWAGNGDEREGSFALFLFSIVSLIAGFALPAIQLQVKASLRLIWAFGLVFFFVISFSTLVTNYSQIVVGLMGISWAISIWIPFTLLGEHLNEQDYLRIDDQQQQLSAGVIMGIHNIYVCVPQIFSTLLNMIIFSYIKNDPFGWCIRVGSLFSLFAGILSLKSKFPCKQN